MNVRPLTPDDACAVAALTRASDESFGRAGGMEEHARGIHCVRLGVDAENESGATRLYQRVGMCVESERVVFEKQLA